jgi:DNA replication and repair protein RecF
VALTRLQIEHVRNLDQVRLDGLAGVNVFFGPNGAGKTSVLESIHLLGMARSFRGNSVKSLITHGHDQCTVFGAASAAGQGAALSMGVQRRRSGDAQIRIGAQSVRSVADLAEQLPLQVINADSFGLLGGSPRARRQYLDWGVFHVEHTFYEGWQRFQRCIKQRNKLLRRGKLSDHELSVWTRDLAATGTRITEQRLAYFQQLTPCFNKIILELAPGLEDIELHFRQGWDRRLPYAEALQQGLPVDLEQGYTHSGPQRADIRVTTGGHSAAETLSRGQQKLVVCALKLAQGHLMASHGRGECAYLIDDLPSELDERHSRLVCEQLASMEAQVFITCVKQEEIRAVWPDSRDLAMFHVEQGAVTAIVTGQNDNAGSRDKIHE